MENHPIPQDVTGFKFKLIGSVTVKQFLYILAGGILAVVFFITPLNAFIKIPISIICGAVGAALAFIPIEGRPMDVMMKNFLKALPAENQYIYRKRGAEALIAEFLTPRTAIVQQAMTTKTEETDARDQKRALLYKTLRHASRPDEKEAATLTNINAYLHEETVHSASPSVQKVDALPQESPTPLQIVTPSVTIATKEVNQAETGLEPLQSAPITASEPQQTADAAPQAPKEPDPQVLISVAQKIDGLNKPAIQTVQPSNSPMANVPVETPVAKPSPQVQQPEEAPKRDEQPNQSPHVSSRTEEGIPQTASPLQTVANQTPIQQAVMPNETANVTTVTPEASLKAGFPSLPDTPNIVMGIIKDPRGRILPNILVEIMDLQGIPVRAFKTNALGQFAAATPLPNGEYNVTLEDPKKQNEFGPIHISLTGEIFDPLEIISVDQREKLRRELFGGAQQAAPTA